MYNFTKEVGEVSAKEVKEILSFLNDIGWWNFVPFNTFKDCKKAMDITEVAIKALEKI